LLARSRKIEIVAEAGDSAEGLVLLRDHRADIILLDIEMPERTGLYALPDSLDVAKRARAMVVLSLA
jgi:two-component system chemotaxis response regulator CheB